MCVSSRDGLAHQKTPFLNIICSGVHNHNVLLEIVDCTDHCAEGNNKDAQYIADTMKPHIMKIDPTKQCVGFVIFDGVSNVQKGGKILEEYDPRITSVYGASLQTKNPDILSVYSKRLEYAGNMSSSG